MTRIQTRRAMYAARQLRLNQLTKADIDRMAFWRLSIMVDQLELYDGDLYAYAVELWDSARERITKAESELRG